MQDEYSKHINTLVDSREEQRSHIAELTQIGIQVPDKYLACVLLIYSFLPPSVLETARKAGCGWVGHRCEHHQPADPPVKGIHIYLRSSFFFANSYCESEGTSDLLQHCNLANA